MRTSPRLVQPCSRRALAPALAVAVLLAGGAACGGDDEPAGAPTTTAPATSAPASSTTEGAPTTSAPTTTAPRTADPEGAIPPADQITPAYVKGVLAGLMEDWRAILLRAKAGDRFDEAYYADLTRIFTSAEGRRQTSGLQQLGGLDVLRADAGPVRLGTPELAEARTDCIALTVDPFDLGPLVTVPLTGTTVGSVRLVPATEGTGGPAWRIAYFDRYGPGGLDPLAACP